MFFYRMTGHAVCQTDPPVQQACMGWQRAAQNSWEHPNFHAFFRDSARGLNAGMFTGDLAVADAVQSEC